MAAKYQHETLGSKTQKQFLGIVFQRISETEKQSLAVVASGACRDPGVTVSAVEIRYATTSSLVDRSAFGKESDFGQLTKLYSKRWNERGDLSKRIGLYNFVFHTYYNN
jgi:hypothetical protein